MKELPLPNGGPVFFRVRRAEEGIISSPFIIEVFDKDRVLMGACTENRRVLGFLSQSDAEAEARDRKLKELPHGH